MDKKRRRRALQREYLDAPGVFSFSDISDHSHVRVRWRCGTCFHVFVSTVDNRMRGTGCPACANRVVTLENCLATRFPQIATLWDTDRNGDLTPYDVVPGSHKAAFFKCARGHSYSRPIYYFVAYPTRCKYCAGQAATPDHNLVATFPEIAAEWHPEKNKTILPSDVLPQSNKPRW